MNQIKLFHSHIKYNKIEKTLTAKVFILTSMIAFAKTKFYKITKRKSNFRLNPMNYLKAKQI
jgi:hypothetical protein